MTKGSLWLPFVFSAALAAAGCASGADEAVQQDLAQMRRDLDALNLALHRSGGETGTVLSQLERRTREQSGESARQLSTMNARIDGLTAEMNRLSARLDELAQRLDSQSRPQGVGPGGRPAPSPVPIPSPSGGARSPGDGTAEESYKAAYLDFTKGNYTLAIAEFREFVRRHPDASQADGAQYWIGESFFSMGRAAASAGQADKAREALERSVQEFRKVFVNYPRGRQVPTALYKEALALVELKQVKVAQARLQYLVDNFPQSEEAPLARERLKNLGQ
ncbi:MAG: tetratricopeptide repeat protein [Candidatus Rokubacteria bacterium]|nr:tetratricopeptide repeat protein [Candidatus Rokubacteria bacterium]